LRDAYNYSQDLAYDTRRLRQELGYQEVVSVDEGLRRTIAWLRAHPPAIDPAQYDYGAEDVGLAAARAARAGRIPSSAW